MMEIHHKQQKKKGIFTVDENGKKLAELDYFRSAPGEITIYHTEVDEELRGEGIGEDLVEAAVKHAREKGLKIIPKCPFAAHVIDERAEFKDVLKSGASL
jgi:predicted GNAT family acetyltransferase